MRALAGYPLSQDEEQLRSLCQIAEAADESNSVKWGAYQHPQPPQYYLDYPHIYGRDYPPYNESD